MMADAVRAAFELSPPGEEGVIRIRVTGDATLDTGHGARKAVVELVRETGATRILVDFRDARIIVPLHQYIQYYRETSLHYPPGTRLALVIGERTVPNPREDMELTRVLGTSAGVALKDFTTMEEALAWLTR